LGTAQGLGTVWALLFGIAALRAQAYPRAAAIVLIVGSVITFLPLPLNGLVLDVAMTWLGLTLMLGQAAAQATAGAQPRCSKNYLSRTIVTGPSLTSATSIIAPKEPVSKEATPASRSLSQK
jgi:hypothetical protein